MAEIVRRPYPSWDRLMGNLRAELFGDAPFEPGRYLFRGVCNADWKLVSSFDRQFPALEDREHRSADLLRAFREESDGQLDAAAIDDDTLLALGQHHGLPTRLLDW